MKNIRILWIILPAALCCGRLPAQTETFLLIEKGDSTGVTAAVSAGNDDLRKLSLDPVNFPAVTLPRSIFRKVVDISNRKSGVGAALEDENRLLRERDTLNAREIVTLRSIMAVQQKNIETCEQTNVLLNRSIQSLNGQLEETRELAKASNKQTGGKLWGMVVGAGIGFGIGVLLGIIAN